MKKTYYLIGLMVMFLFLLAGCAPGPSPPPFMGSIGVFLMGWILIGLIVLIVIILWKKNDSTSGRRTYITDAINDINERLKDLEKKIDKLYKNNGKD